MKKLSTIELTRFKQEFTDENRLIAQAISQVLPSPGDGILLDVGAGLGDIAELAFTDRRALLIDILEFSSPQCSLHVRQTIDFFDLPSAGKPTVDVMVMSHVLQYLDDDIAKLAQKIRQIAPSHIIVACNRPTKLFAQIERWFDSRGIVHNGEKALSPCPLEGYRPCTTISLAGAVSCPSFVVLAQQLANVIFDTDLSNGDIADLEKWLGSRLTEPKITIPQSVILYEEVLTSAN